MDSLVSPAGELAHVDPSGLCVSPESSLKEAMTALDRGRLGLVLVTDECGRLLGVVTDGDVRRAILRQVTLDQPISAVMNSRFTSLPSNATYDEAFDTMKRFSIKHVPVLDESGVVVKLFCLQDFVGVRSRANWAVIMAGGEGRRLRPLTDATPKPMLPVGGRPVLEAIVRHLVRHGFQSVFVSINYLGEQIESYFGDGRRFGCHVEYLRELQPLGTGGALRLLPKPTERILVINGDLVTDADLSALLDYHEEYGYAATVCVREFTYRIPYGVLYTQNSEVKRIEEKPVHCVLINAGIYVLEPFLLECIPSGQEYPLPEVLERALADGHPVGAYPIRERWIDIGYPEEYERVRTGAGF